MSFHKPESHLFGQRCDGERPICGPCSRFRGHELDDCEFYEGQPPKAQVLQEQVTELEIRLARAQGLGDPSELPLHDPQAQNRGTSTRSHAHAPRPAHGNSFETEDFKVEKPFSDSIYKIAHTS